MSLSVPAHLLEDARRGRVLDHDFVECVRASLPYAYATVARLAARLAGSDRSFVDNQEAPPDETACGELLRAMSSDAIRGALERHFNVVLAFQTCHRVAVFPPRARTSPEYRDFTSVESQLLNQRAGLVNC
ncbi:MAG TPA: SCO5389 family protein [Streptosporangiales bacterium]